jgi:hypothetical protein
MDGDIGEEFAGDLGVDLLDGQSTADALDANRGDVLAVEARQFALVAHWADLHNADTLPHNSGEDGEPSPGREKAKQYGGQGTPTVAEFAVHELGVQLRCTPVAAHHLVTDALDVRHRHPRLWHSVVHQLEGRVWQARQIAKRTHAAKLTLEQARWVDTHTTPYIGSLSWTKFLELLDAKIIEADPTAAEQRRIAAAMDQFVATGQCNEFGLKTVIIKATAGEVIFFVAMIDRIAQILLLEGDTRPVGVRRAAAIGILANPAHALILLAKYAGKHGEGFDPAATMPAPAPEGNADEGADVDDTTDQPIREQDLHPSQNDADDPAPEMCPSCSGSREMRGDPTPFIKPNLDLSKLLPKATLYVHASEATFTGTQDASGVVRVEGVGPVTTQQAQEFLRHCHVSVKKVLDVGDQRPVDGYEVPDEMREAVRLLHPTCVYPWSPSSSRDADQDHSKKYVPEEQGGPKGQTRPDNLGPLKRPEHRVKTFGRGWRHYQPQAGIYLWRTPHGYWFRVDHTGTQALGKHPDLTKYGINADSPDPGG